MRDWLHSVRTLVWKDLLQEWRSKDMLTAMFAFAILTLFIFNYAIELSPVNRAEIASGIIWVVMVFAGTLGLNRSFTAEQDQGCFDALVMAVPDVSAIYFGKMLTNWLVMLFVSVLILPIYSLLYNQSLINLGFILILVLGAWCYSAAGTLIAGMTVQTRMRDLLLPILLFPILMPVNMAVVKAAGGILAGAPLVEVQAWLVLLAAYGIIVTTVSILVFEYVIRIKTKISGLDCLFLILAFTMKIFMCHPSIWARQGVLLPRQRCRMAHAGFLVAAVCGILYLNKKQLKYDFISFSAVEIGLLFTAIANFTGMIWAKPIWNTWWTWDPRLTTMTIMAFTYIGYLLLRRGVDNLEKRARFGAVYAIIAFASVPLTFFSSRLLRTIHPTIFGANSGDMAMTPAMYQTMAVSIVAFTFLFAGLLWHRSILAARESEIDILRAQTEVAEFGEVQDD